ncbi:MAG: DUF6622 family protein [Candidatus Babeliales bacterium]
MNILSILQGTPYWVWNILAYLIISGAKATKPVVFPLWRFGIMPLVFVVWSLTSLHTRCGSCLSLYAFWVAALFFGIGVGYCLLQRTSITFDAQGSIHLPGSFVPLLLSLLFFAGKYSLGVTYALNPALKTSFLLGFDVALSGVISGISLGRFLNIVYRYKKA